MAIISNLTRKQKVTRGVWAATIGAVIFVGALTGAQLKTEKQKDESIKQFRQITPADQIAILEEQKKHLLQQKAVLERKVEVFRRKMLKREAAAKAKED